MGAYFPMAPLAVRLGFVRKREKEARRTAEAQQQASSPAAATRPAHAVEPKPTTSSFERRENRRKREAKQKAEALRVKEDVAVSGAARNLLKAVRESVALIDRLPRDDKGRLRTYDVTEDGAELEHFEKPSRVFRRFTFEELRALSVVACKHRAAAKRLSRSVASARGAWDGALFGCKKMEGRRP